MLAKALILTALAAVAVASPCKPSSTTSTGPTSTNINPVVTPTLPSTGGSTELPAPPANAVLKKIVVGHGLQNYTCAANQTTAATSNGALAVLYDITDRYPGTAGTGFNQSFWDDIATTVLENTDLPINIVDPSGRNPDVALPESGYAADPSQPFPPPADLILGDFTLKFEGHHFFDLTNTPTFSLDASSLLANVVKNATANAPTSADPGILKTGAVAWLKLIDSGKGISNGIDLVYRVATAGGAAQPCAVSGAGAGNVPYAAVYWFFEA